MSGKLIAPDYHIRLFTRQKGLLPINNVVSISVTEEVNGVGNFSMVLNYKDSLKERDFNTNSVSDTDTLKSQGYSVDDSTDFLHVVEPMDYIEIYMRNKLPTRVDGNIMTYGDIADGKSQKEISDNLNLPVGFGIFDGEGGYHPFEYQYDTKKKSWDYENNPFNQKHLDIIDRINNPDLVFCGFVRNIVDNFSIAGTSITVSGEGVGCFLKLHQLYFGAITEDLMLKSAFCNSMVLTATIEEVIKYILGDLMAKSLKAGYNISDPSNPNKTISTGTVKLEGNEGTAQIISVYNQEPSCNDIYWSENKKDIVPERFFAPWGRISKVQYGFGLSKNEIQTKVTVWDAIYKNAGVPFNEFWVDRTGNVVFRKMIDAVSQGAPKYETNAKQVVTQVRKAGYDNVMDPNTGVIEEKFIWTVIDTNEIISWNLIKSDQQLKTMVISHLEVGSTGTEAILLDYIRAPISSGAMDTFKKSKANIGDKNSLDFIEILRYLESIQAKQTAGISLIDKDGLTKFWQRYGVRVEDFMNFTSHLPAGGLIDAYVLFLYRLFNLYTGTMTIIGNPKIKAGTVIYIKRLNSTYYVNKVTHNYTFGGEMTTILTLENGRIQNSFSDPFVQIQDLTGIGAK